MSRSDVNKGTSTRGFASMDQAKQRAIASKGGQSVPAEKRSFSQDPALAAQAGRKGGESVPPEGRSFSQNRELAAAAGRKGGQARGALNLRAAAKRNAAKLRALDMASRKGGLSKAAPNPQTEDKRAALARPASISDRSEYGAEGGISNADRDDGDLRESSGQARYAGSNEHPHEAS